jgi:DNA polymerase-1
MSHSGSLYLVDAHSLIFQVFHAIRGMTNPAGLPTNALFGFTRDLLYLRSFRPTYLLCAFDRSEPTFRSELYADYKAHRPPMPSDLQLQLPHFPRLLQALGVPGLSALGFEADDVMATVAQAASARGIEVFLCTSDKDCRQLINDKVRLYNLRKREEFGKNELLEDWGITPEQVVDLQALVGDSVDNVPGVPGIGVKTAAKLLQEFGTLDNLLNNIDRVPGAKKQEALRESGELVALSRRLVKLATDVPIEIDWEAWRLQPIRTDELLALCQEFGFQSLSNQVRALGRAISAPAGSPDSAPARPAQTGPVQAELFPFGANAEKEKPSPANGTPPAPKPRTASPSSASNGGWVGNYRLVDTPEKFKEFFRELQEQTRIAVDLETTSLQPLEAEIVGLAFCWGEGRAWYLPLKGPARSTLLDGPGTLRALKPILENPGVAKVNQNIKYDLLVLRTAGVEIRGVAGDPMVADYLLHAGERTHNLEDLSRRYLNHQVIPITDLIGVKQKKVPQLRMDQVPTGKVAVYAGEDADVAWRLCGKLEPQLQQGDGALRKLYDDLEVPLIEVLAELEYNGVRLDVKRLAKLSEEMAVQLEGIEKEIYALAGHEFNIGSLPQLRKVLFDELKMPVRGRTGVTNAPSTDQESLEKLAALDHPGSALPRKILEHRQISKLKGTYVDALPGMVNPRTGRVHASFNQTVTVTGRLSASDPNLQNIPVRREMGQQIRQAFIPQEGWLLLCADYSQIELRLLAHFCADEELLRAFAEDRDVHTAVAAQIFAVPEAEVTSSQRRMAKTVNFGVVYGISAPGLAQRLHIKRDEASAFINDYFKRYPKVEEYQAGVLTRARQTGQVGTLLGRRRQFDPTAIRPFSSPQNRNQAEREAINMEVQGSAADLIKLAMLHVHRRLRGEGWKARMLLQIHDELVFEAPPEELKGLASLVRQEMTAPVERALGLHVRLAVDLAAGPNWLDVSPLEE